MFLRNKKNLIGFVISKKRRIILGAIIFLSFWIFKTNILNYYLDSVAYFFTVGTYKFEEDIKYKLLEQENKELRDLLHFPSIELKKNFVFAQVINNIYSNAYFWVQTNDASKVQHGALVWHQDRLIGFVEEKQGDFIKVRPVTHIASKFACKTFEGAGVLIKGEGNYLSVVLSNSLDLKKGDLLLFDHLKVGVLRDKKYVKCADFANIRWVCIYI